MPLNFLKDGIIWVASKIYCVNRALGAEAIEINHWILRFDYTSEDL